VAYVVELAASLLAAWVLLLLLKIYGLREVGHILRTAQLVKALLHFFKLVNELEDEIFETNLDIDVRRLVVHAQNDVLDSLFLHEFRVVDGAKRT